MNGGESLCENCRHLRTVISAKGSRFLLCLLSQTDARLSKYPPQPVRQCSGYQENEAGGKGKQGSNSKDRTMAMPREPWNIHPAKKRAPVSASVKADVESNAKALIENVLKPKHVSPPKERQQFNYITDIGAKWYRNYFYFFLTYACPGPNALSPTFEWTFARMEPLGDGTFALYAMRHTGKEWIGVFDALSVDECMKAIQDDPWFGF
jgi:hypothetical protein